MKLIKYRDSRDRTYRWFWIGTKEQILSPDFASQEAAEEWMQMKKEEMFGQLKGIGRPT